MSKLHNLSQTIHATLLSPPTQFLLVSTVVNEQWCISLFNTSKSDNARVWISCQSLGEVEDEDDVVEAIKEGLLHVDCGSRRKVDLESIADITLHILVKPQPLLITLTKGKTEDHIGQLIGVAYQLLARPEPRQNGTSDLKELKVLLFQKDAEIANLNSKLSSLKATVVRATASDNKKKVQQSPQKAKPLPGASQLQPNQKRRKIVEDEFAGSSDDDEED
ncbi:uncharacterized protein IL334_002073 [Kwoniella shivajii]|uniref:Uncharacterized protein n=1 Tax=Kwoniella shivajii TaxID=564305 RepID=A0ABZ1CTZ3_9TREE|nr:hypothetical protein IL334_002073 [Kwoniella shivajii]